MTLSTAELVATSSSLCPSNASRLFVQDIHSGKYLAASEEHIVAAAKRVLERSIASGMKLDSPDRVREYLCLELGGREQEVFAAILLNTQHCVIQYIELFRGTLDSAAVYPREVVKVALQHNAGAVIFAHNHPGGNPEPSDADRRITERLRKALELIEVRMLDHIVVAGAISISFREQGYL